MTSKVWEEYEDTIFQPERWQTSQWRVFGVCGFIHFLGASCKTTWKTKQAQHIQVQNPSLRLCFLQPQPFRQCLSTSITSRVRMRRFRFTRRVTALWLRRGSRTRALLSYDTFWWSHGCQAPSILVFVIVLFCSILFYSRIVQELYLIFCYSQWWPE